MMQAQILDRSSDGWENEGGGLLSSVEPETSCMTRFLTQFYVVEGQAYASLSEAVAQGRPILSGQAPL